MRMIKAFVLLLITICAASQFALAQSVLSSKCSLICSQEKDVDDWRCDYSSGVPIWIGWVEERNTGFNFLIFIESKDYNIENLKKVFAALSKQYEKALYISAEVITSRNVLRNEITAKRKGYWSAEEMIEMNPDLADKQIEDLSATNGRSFKASYFRAKQREDITYQNPNNGRFEKINLLPRNNQLKTNLKNATF